MCWAVPAKVVSVSGVEAVVDFGGTRRRVLVAEAGVREGDLVLVHAGVIVGRISEEEFLESLKIYRDIAVEAAVASGKSREEAEREADAELERIIRELGVGSGGGRS